MKKRLEELEPGTAVFVDDRQVGEVRAVYAGTEGNLPEYLNLYCISRDAELLVPANEVLSLEERGVILTGPVQSYSNLTIFDADSRPGLRRIR